MGYQSRGMAHLLDPRLCPDCWTAVFPSDVQPTPGEGLTRHTRRDPQIQNMLRVGLWCHKFEDKYGRIPKGLTEMRPLKTRRDQNEAKMKSCQLCGKTVTLLKTY